MSVPGPDPHGLDRATLKALTRVADDRMLGAAVLAADGGADGRLGRWTAGPTPGGRRAQEGACMRDA
jgi:hypothetical protein